jgi:NADPH:quinone reductase-like Zn-dependent oxidoreductase
MRAVVYERYGPPEVLHLKEVATPAASDREVLIKVHATTVTSGDRRVRGLDLPRGFGPLARPVFGILRPRQPILGTELSGEIAAVGKDVGKFSVGDQVLAFPGAAMGCYAEYKVMREDGAVVHKPENLSHEQAVALPFGGMTALDFYRRGKLKSGERVLVNGASGAVGVAAVQLGKHFGAHVTGVCSTGNLELVRSLGADEVIDYTRQDFTGNGQRYDVIVDTAGTAPFARCGRSLREGGRLLQVLGTLADLLVSPWISLTSGKKVIAGPASERPDDLRLLAKLAESGELKPVIDRRYPLERIVEAHRYVDTGRKRGSVVIGVATGAAKPAAPSA